MAKFPPVEGRTKKPSLDKSARVTVNTNNEALSALSLSDLETLKPNQQSLFCPQVEIRSASITDDEEHQFGRISFVTGCRRWSCPVCGPKKRFQLVKRIAEGKPNRFLTLTVLPKENESPREAFTRTSPKIATLFRPYRSQIGFRYARILESTKRGFPHYHFAIHSRWISQRELSSNWFKLTGSKIVDIRKLFGRHVNYLAKYVTKNDSVAYTRQRISFSRGWPKLGKIDIPWTLADWNQVYNDRLRDWTESTIADRRSTDFGSNGILSTNNDSQSQIVLKLYQYLNEENDET